MKKGWKSFITAIKPISFYDYVDADKPFGVVYSASQMVNMGILESYMVTPEELVKIDITNQIQLDQWGSCTLPTKEKVILIPTQFGNVVLTLDHDGVITGDYPTELNKLFPRYLDAYTFIRIVGAELSAQANLQELISGLNPDIWFK